MMRGTASKEDRQEIDAEGAKLAPGHPLTSIAGRGHIPESPPGSCSQITEQQLRNGWQWLCVVFQDTSYEVHLVHMKQSLCQITTQACDAYCVLQIVV